MGLCGVATDQCRDYLVARRGAFLRIASLSPPMRYFKFGLWILFFFIATFFWVVVFEHGFSGIGHGIKLEFESLRSLFR